MSVGYTGVTILNALEGVMLAHRFLLSIHYICERRFMLQSLLNKTFILHIIT